MKVAVSVNKNGTISSHLGKSNMFFIFSNEDGVIRFIEKRVTNGNYTNHIIEDIKDCQAVISGKIGAGMADNLLKLGITPYVEELITNPKKAVEERF